jgi:hypothetical protein
LFKKEFAMQKILFLMMSICMIMIIVSGCTLSNEDESVIGSDAGDNTRIDIGPMPTGVIFILKPDLQQWDNLGIGPSGEFPFYGECWDTLMEVGVLHNPSQWSMWVINSGFVSSAACKARIRLYDGRYPHWVRYYTADIPALAPNQKFYLRFNTSSLDYILKSKQVTVTLDYTNIVDESNESNNTSIWSY